MEDITIVEQRQGVFVFKAGEEILDPSQKCDLERIVLHLSAPNTVWGLVNDGHAMAVIEVVKTMTPEQQVEVLSTPDVLWILKYHGQTAAIVELMRSIPMEHQAVILSATNHLWSAA